MTQRPNLHRAIRHILAASALAAVSSLAHAEAAGGQVTLEEVVVTGSRIARPELESTTPISIISAPAIQSTGSLNTADVLRNLPAIGVSGLSGSNSNFLTSSAGVNTINLRNLGDSRTLVLVNGRRMVPGIAGDSAVDFNMIPTDFIERIDVITGGASAVYGSEAVSGVVNVILKEHFNGVRIRAQGGGSSGGGANTKLGSLTMGSDFADSRGNAFFNITYDKDSGLYSRQRDISKVDTSASGPLHGAYSSYNPQGGYYLTDSTGTAIDGRFTYKPDGSIDYASVSDGFNRNAWRRITIPVDRTIVSSTINYELTDKHKAYVEFTYGQTHTESDIEPFALGIGSVNGVGLPASPTTDNVFGGTGLGISINNPFVPAGLLDIIALDNEGLTCTGDAPDPACVTGIGVRKRLTGVAIRSSSARRQTTRFVAGVKGELFGTPWTYDVYYMHGRTTDNQMSTGQVNVQNVRNALDAIIDGNGDIVCRDVVAVAQGCVPLNVFGANSITPAMAAYITAPSTRDATIQQQVMSAIVQGPLFKLPAGEVRAVIGAEHRTEQSSEIMDSLTNAGLNGGNQLPNVFGSYTVKDVFAEVSVPLLSGVTGVKDLGVEAAFRSSDYTTVGRVSTWNLRLNYAPIDDLRFRGAFSHATRAPNIGELYSGAAQTFPGNFFSDPCDGIDATTTGAVAAACRAIPGIGAVTGDGGTFEYGFLDYQQITGYNSGNPALRPETAKTYTGGFVVTPMALRNFNASVDYFSIQIDNAVGTVDYGTQLTACLLDSTKCTGIYRNAISGKLTRVDQSLVNISTLKTAGIDFAARYRQVLPRAIGSLDFGLNYTHLSKFEQTAPDTPTQTYVGQIGYPKNKASLQIDYDTHGFEIGWTIRYQSAMQDQVNPDYVSSAQAAFNNVPAYTYHDLQLKYEFGDKVHTSIYGGVRNVFDKKPPFLPSGMTNQATGTETAPDTYDAIGRQMFLGFDVKL